MRWTKIVLAASLAVSAAAPAVAGSGGRAVTGRDAQLQEWLRGRAHIGAKLPYSANSNLESWGVYAEVVDAGDLDGDGKSDVLDLRTHIQFDDVLGFYETLRIDAYRGSDGKALWTQSLPPAYYTFPVVTKVGADGKPGVVVLMYNGASAGALVAGGGGGGVTITSIDRVGRPVWSRALAGGGAGSVAHYNDVYSDVDGFFDAVAGGGTDLLVRTTAAAEGGDPTGTVYEAHSESQFGVLDGATGVLRAVGEPVESPWGTYGTTAGDLDGDKLADFAVESSDDDGITMRGMSSASGKVLWTLAASNEALAGVLPDVTGDGIADLAVRSYDMGGFIEVGPSAADHESGPETRVGVLDGKRGKVVWRKPGTYLKVLGNVDRKGAAEVVVGSPVTGSSIGFTVAAYTGSGKRLWTTTRKVQRVIEHKESPSTNSWGTVGDTNADGVEEIGYAIKTGQGTKLRRDEGSINGRTGRVAKDPVPDMWATRAALDSRGTDAYTATSSRGVFTVDAWRGDAPGRLWTTAVRTSGTFMRATPLLVDGDRCGDLAMTLFVDETKSVSVVYSGSTGRPLWQVSREGMTPAKVGPASVAKQKTYRKGC